MVCYHPHTRSDNSTWRTSREYLALGREANAKPPGAFWYSPKLVEQTCRFADFHRH